MNYQNKSYILFKQSDFPNVDFLKPGRVEATIVFDHAEIHGDYLTSEVLEVKSLNHMDVATEEETIALMEEEAEQEPIDSGEVAPTEEDEMPIPLEEEGQ